MKRGLQIGTCASVRDIVTPLMQAAFGGEIVHPVYGTAAMVYHMEWAARLVILPYLEEDEEGVGTGVRLKHLSPAPVGTEIEAQAVCMKHEGNVILCDVNVFTNGELLGSGQVEQRVLPRQVLHERFPEMWTIEGE